MKTFLCVAFSCVLISLCRADDAKPVQINVAFVEGKPTKADSTKTLIQTNAERYMDGITSAADKSTKKTIDIVVFPEYGLTEKTGDKKLAVKIDVKNSSSSPELEGLHTLAKKNKVILVANLLEKEDDNGDELYSTTVVLDGTDQNSNGLLAKYRKINLNDGDDEKNLTSSEEITSFNHTKFGTIGILSGDDILYENPVKKLKENGVTTFLYTSSQKVVGPFKTTVSLHAGFAKAHGVNLVVSSLSDVDRHISGSGIYTPCGPLKDYIDTASDDFYDIQTINVPPVTNCSPSQVQFNILRTAPSLKQKPLADLPDYDIADLKTEIIEQNRTNVEVCDGDFCCNFNITARDWNKETYRLVVKGGNDKICGMMMCSDKNNITSCGRIQKESKKTSFSSVNITTTESETLFSPYILHSDLLPGLTDLNRTTFKVVSDKDAEGTTFQIEDVQDVVAIGIVSAKSAANSLGIAFSVLVISVFLKYLF